MSGVVLLNGVLFLLFCVKNKYPIYKFAFLKLNFENRQVLVTHPVNLSSSSYFAAKEPCNIWHLALSWCRAAVIRSQPGSKILAVTN
jgi:hypothetical protein